MTINQNHKNQNHNTIQGEYDISSSQDEIIIQEDMSLESAKMRLEQAVARRDHVHRELEDTDRQLQE